LRFFKKIFAVGIFLLAIFVAIEITYRYYVAGSVALSPLRSNSLNTLMRSEFVQLSEYPDIFFELKPNMEGWFKGVRFATNSAGQVDQEYSKQKPAGKYRVVIAGSSWTMPSGVEQKDSWHAVLEREQNEISTSQPLDLINMGVELYGLRELVGTVRHKAFQWDPDLVIVAVTTFTTSFVWEEPGAEQRLPDRVYPALRSYSLRALARSLGLPTDEPSRDRPLLDPTDRDARAAQILRAIDELSDLQKRQGVPIVILFLGYVPLATEVEDAVRQRADEVGITLVFANRIFPSDPQERPAFQISRYDRHPNAAGHRIISDFVAKSLREAGYLPDSDRP
jgi:hypothetical protein